MSDPSRGCLGAAGPVGGSGLLATRSNSVLGIGLMPTVPEDRCTGRIQTTTSRADTTNVLDFSPTYPQAAAEFGDEYREDLVDVLDTIGAFEMITPSPYFAIC
jgi:hypothetical protein